MPVLASQPRTVENRIRPWERYLGPEGGQCPVFMLARTHIRHMLRNRLRMQDAQAKMRAREYQCVSSIHRSR